jgi:hypothetical protein
MSRNNKQSGPTMRYGRQIAYDREMVIEICKRVLRGEDLEPILQLPPMPIRVVFLSWIEHHKEAHEIYKSMRDFESFWSLGERLDLGRRTTSSDWEDQVRCNLRRGWPADWKERKYLPPDWAKVYPVLGSSPPVLSNEDRQAYDNRINVMTQWLEPRDEIELMYVKQATDGWWEAERLARAKKDLLNGCSLQDGLKFYQALDIAQTRALKNCERALRELKRWRDARATQPRALADRFIADETLAELYAERYGMDPRALGTEAPDPGHDETAPERADARSPLDRANETAVDRASETVEPSALGRSGETLKATATAVVAPDEILQAPSPLAFESAIPKPACSVVDVKGAVEPACTPPPFDSAGDVPFGITSLNTPKAAAPLGPASEAAQPAPTLTLSGTAPEGALALARREGALEKLVIIAPLDAAPDDAVIIPSAGMRDTAQPVAAGTWHSKAGSP